MKIVNLEIKNSFKLKMASTLKIPMSSKILIHTYLIKSTLGDLKIKAFNFVFIMKNKLIVNGSWNAKIMLFFLIFANK